MKYGVYIQTNEHWDIYAVVTTGEEAGSMVAALLQDGQPRVEAAVIDG